MLRDLLTAGRDTVIVSWNFLQHPRDVSYIFPTLPWGVRKVADKVHGDVRRVVVEYGPGTGRVAQTLLQPGRLTPDSKVILIEKTPALAERLARRLGRDPRVRVFCDSAENVGEIMQECGESRADYILSSIPLTLLPGNVRERILRETRDILSEDGAFIVYILRRRVRGYLQEFFAAIVMERVWRNIPPLIIFEAGKK